MPKVALIVGSNHTGSINAMLAKALTRLAEGTLEITAAKIDDLPVYSQDFDSDMPESAKRMKREIEAADGVILLTPEHNRSITTLTKNAIDWASRPYGKSSWKGKPVAIGGASRGNIGTAAAQQHLRAILAHLDAAVMGQPELFFTMKQGLVDEAGNVTDESTRKFLEGYLQRFATWIRQVSSNPA